MTPSWIPPTEFEEYRLLRPLGRGAMGQVWLAHDALLDRRVALKFIGAGAGDAAVRERFLNEARAIARLSHPNVVVVHRIGSLEGQPFIVSEWVEGESLDRLPAPLEGGLLLRLAVDLSRGLAAAHRAAILHRDVKPANAMLASDGVAKLLDFGLAKTVTDLAPPAPRPEPVPAPAHLDPEATLDSPRAQDGDGPRHSRGSAALTHAGALIGTPLYLAPECWRREPATRRSDVYSLGALLYELAAGQPPLRFLGDAPLEELGLRPARPLREVAPGVEPRLAEVIDRCLQPDPRARFASGDELREAVEALLGDRAARPVEGNPYRGLAAFEAEHRALFFGRAVEVRAACDRLRSSNLLVVAGESGAGKSSLCRAGVLPEVELGALGGPRRWRSVTCLPGPHPLRALLLACAPCHGEDAEQLANKVRDEPRALARAILRKLGPTEGLVVFGDQLEEWVTLGARDEVELAARALASLCDGLPAVRVLTTARTDLLSSLSTLPDLGPLLSTSLFLLGPVRPEELTRVVEGPARLLGVRFESPEMVQRLVDFAAQGGALPLLQFALATLWEARAGASVLTEASLARLGGVAGALAAHADAVLASLSSVQREAARVMLTALVSAGDRRRRRLEAELLRAPADRAVLATLARARLIAARDSSDGTTWELAHEALLREWKTLRAWLGEDASARAQRERLEVAVAEWKRLARSAEALWGARALVEFDAILPVLPADVGDDARRFLSASRRASRLRRLRVPLAMVVLGLAALLTFVGTRQAQLGRLRERIEAHYATSAAHHARAQGHAQAWRSARDAAFTAFDVGDFAQGEGGWARARALERQWRQELERALVELESAQLLSPSADGLTERYLEALRARLTLAHETGTAPAFDGVDRRLQALGAAREVAALLEQPATVTLRVEPAGARLRLEPPPGAVAPTPTRGAPLALAPGTWVLQAEAEGFVPARLPFEVRGGDALEPSLRLLPRAKVAEGFVHVPAGSSWVGAGGDEAVRLDFYGAAPLHRVALGDFLIAQHEVTFGDWVRFLEALPAAEREERTPRLDNNAGAAATARLALTRVGGEWNLELVFDGHRVAAPASGKLHYPTRANGAEQAWLKGPVVGVTVLDALAYARWLSETGQVPGARLCTEYEWERAARGADGRTFPHGEALEADDANIDVTYGRRDGAYGFDEVGSHPASRSPFGVDDLQGNVWEFVRPANAAVEWTTKGGSWQTSALSSRLPNQSIVNPSYRQLETGIRLCASP